ncbi:MAG: hypothetical protein ACNA8W_21580, partial [Bradymonadaceae bacterium]
EIGFADVILVDSNREMRNASTTGAISLVNGQGLAIKFRVEEGALPTNGSFFSGVRTNVPMAELSAWEVCMTETYDQSGTSITGLEAACDKANLMLACRLTDSTTLLVAAHAPREDVLTDTGMSNTPHDANGVGWYFSRGWSWGFARQGDPINRNSCDLETANPAERLCWHTQGGGDVLSAGWRCGVNMWLNGSTAYERLILHAD